ILDRVGALDLGADVLLIDCGAGIGRAVLSFLAAADRCLVVTTPEPTAITDAYALIKVAVGAGGSPGAGAFDTGLPTVDPARVSTAAQERIAGVCRRFLGMRPLLAGWTPRDEAVHRAVRTRTPFMLDGAKRPAAQRIDMLARDLLAGIPHGAPRSGKARGGFV